MSIGGLEFHTILRHFEHTARPINLPLVSSVCCIPAAKRFIPARESTAIRQNHTLSRQRLDRLYRVSRSAVQIKRDISIGTVNNSFRKCRAQVGGELIKHARVHTAALSGALCIDSNALQNRLRFVHVCIQIQFKDDVIVGLPTQMLDLNGHTFVVFRGRCHDL